MRTLVKVIMLVLGVVGLALMLPATPTYAVTCATVLSGTCTEKLINNNVDSGVKIEVDVIIDNTGPKTTLEVKWISDDLSNPPDTIRMFAYNSSDKSNSSNQDGNWILPSSGGSADGFGDFETINTLKSDRADTLDVIFTLKHLDNAVNDFSANDHGANFAVLMEFGDHRDCDVWVSNGTSTNINPNCECKTEQVPEPSVLLFMGVGLVAVGVWGRKRFSNRNL